MRGLEKKTTHDGADRQTDRRTDRRTWGLLDQLFPEGRVGEKEVGSILSFFFMIFVHDLYIFRIKILLLLFILNIVCISFLGGFSWSTKSIL